MKNIKIRKAITFTTIYVLWFILLFSICYITEPSEPIYPVQNQFE